MSLSDLIKSINEKCQGVHASMMSESEIATSKEYVRTPSLDLNRILSGDLFKGICTRNLVGIVGPEHTFKSSFMILCMVEALKQGYEAFIIDTEHGVTDDFCSRWGLPLDKVGYTYAPWIENVLPILGQIKDSNQQKMIIGIDSVGGLDTYKLVKGAADGDVKADQGQLQKQIRRMLRLLLNICVEQNSIGIVTGHMYGQPGVVPMPDQIGGGKAMRMFPSIIIQLRKDTAKKDRPMGNEMVATTIKNRMYPPFQEAMVKIDYREGINPYAGLMNILSESKIVEKSGASFSYHGERIGYGADDAEASLGKINSILDELNDWLKTTGYSTVNPLIKEAETLIEGELVVEEKEEDKPKRGRPPKESK